MGQRLVQVPGRLVRLQASRQRRQAQGPEAVTVNFLLPRYPGQLPGRSCADAGCLGRLQSPRHRRRACGQLILGTLILLLRKRLAEQTGGLGRLHPSRQRRQAGGRIWAWRWA